MIVVAVVSSFILFSTCRYFVNRLLSIISFLLQNNSIICSEVSCDVFIVEGLLFELLCIILFLLKLIN